MLLQLCIFPMFALAISPLPLFSYPVSEVKNERNCNASYIFATVSALESGYAQLTGISSVINFSEQYVLSTAESADCSGGTPEEILNFLSTKGTYQEPIYPYYGVKINLPTKTATKYFINGYQTVNATNYTDFVGYLKNSSLIVGVYIDNTDFFVYYNKTSYVCGTPTSQVHYMLAVYSEEYDEKGLIYLKNNWGTGWGISGYMIMNATGGDSGFGPCNIFQNIYILEPKIS